ncbi:MAG: tRNA epoxyqueuosine(34) reductase QueG, partial [Alphaproteobacteria bacterium]|nr:tRNA epoxyqueuosine(34) reductase QueG [Alphaproteobacteria bacterium]
MPTLISDARAAIRARALAEGFDAVGFCHAEAVPLAGARLRRFLALGRHGDMGWLAAKADRRESPRALWPEARSVVMVGLNYAPASDPMRRLRLRERGAISVYAQGSDYHDLVKRRLKRLGRWIGETLACDLKVFVDTAPVPEKPLAAAAGIGWQGKHTNLVSRRFGSWLFLGAIYLARELPPDGPEADHCGSCRNCLDVCPTAAFPAPYQLDARRCISYLTIEHAGTIPRGLRRAIGNRIYGCDDCLAVCPWNKFAQPTRHEALRPRAEFDLPRLADLAELDDGGFRKLFAGTAVRRIGRDRLLRNVAIALGNSGEAGAVPPLRRLLADPAPGARAMAVWALGQLLPRSDWDELRRRMLP